MVKYGKANEYFEMLGNEFYSTWTKDKIQSALNLEQNAHISFCIWTNDMALLPEIDEQIFLKRPDLKLIIERRWQRNEAFGYDGQGKAIPKFFGSLCKAMFENLSQMKYLKKVTVRADDTTAVELLEDMIQLEELTLDYSDKISISFLSKLKGLKHLTLAGCYKDMEAIANCTQLESLTIEGNQSGSKINKPILDNLSFLNKLTKLNYLSLNICRINCDLSAITDMPALRSLIIANSNIESLDFISNCIGLETLLLHRIPTTKLCDFSNLVNLKTISLEHSKSLTAYTLSTAKSLEYLKIEGMKAMTEKELAETLQQIPSLKKIYFDLGFKLEPVLKKFKLERLIDLADFNETHPAYSTFGMGKYLNLY